MIWNPETVPCCYSGFWGSFFAFLRHLVTFFIPILRWFFPSIPTAVLSGCARFSFIFLVVLAFLRGWVLLYAPATALARITLTRRRGGQGTVKMECPGEPLRTPELEDLCSGQRMQIFRICPSSPPKSYNAHNIRTLANQTIIQQAAEANRGQPKTLHTRCSWR